MPQQLWYSPFLKALQEPPIWDIENNKDDATYRFLRLGFARNVIVRLTIRPDGTGIVPAKLVVVRADSVNDIFTADAAPVAHEQIVKFQDLLQKANFWSMEPKEAPRVYHFDESHWVMEGVRSGSYHVVDRWSSQNTEYSRACEYLMRLAPIEEATRNRKIN